MTTEREVRQQLKAIEMMLFSVASAMDLHNQGLHGLAVKALSHARRGVGLAADYLPALAALPRSQHSYKIEEECWLAQVEVASASVVLAAHNEAIFRLSPETPEELRQRHLLEVSRAYLKAESAKRQYQSFAE